jgi:hypothetical protein
MSKLNPATNTGSMLTALWVMHLLLPGLFRHHVINPRTPVLAFRN